MICTKFVWNWFGRRRFSNDPTLPISGLIQRTTPFIFLSWHTEMWRIYYNPNPQQLMRKLMETSSSDRQTNCIQTNKSYNKWCEVQNNNVRFLYSIYHGSKAVSKRFTIRYTYIITPADPQHSNIFLSASSRLYSARTLTYWQDFSLSIAGYPFNTWVEWGNSCKVPFPRTQRQPCHGITS